jgi:hypothetical protein
VTDVPRARFDHLLDMTDERGTFEHARLAEPRREHGYCTDDMARVLLVSIREPYPTPEVRGLIEISLRFLNEAQSPDGDYCNRMSERGRWQDRPTLEDCWGRSVWALGTAAAHAHADSTRKIADAQFERAARRRSPWPRAMSFAAIGAAELLSASPAHRGARTLLTAAADSMPTCADDATWPWPEPRLAYANAVIPEAMIAAGAILDRPPLLRHGLDLLGWLLQHETSDGHLSVTPAGGSAPGGVRPAFDQQPIEVAALADACARAASIDASDQRWADGLRNAVAWFLGCNDGNHVMWDPTTGGGFDGLEAGGPNRNQGTESTLALLSTLQHGRRLVLR